MFADPDRLVTPEEVADEFRIAPRTVVKWAQEQKLPSIRTPGGQYRFRQEIVAKLRESRQG